MEKTVKVTVSYPVTFEINLDDLENTDILRDMILAKADYYLESSSVKPIITDCSMKELVN